VVLLVYLLGFWLGMGLFFLVFLLLLAQAGLPRAVLLTAGALGFMAALASAMTLRLPEGLLPLFVENALK
jgi:hypothetical protein